MALFIFPVFAQAQDCKLIKKTDPYTKEKTISTGFVRLSDAKVTIDATKTDVDVFFIINGKERCFSDASTAAIYFVGKKSKMSQRNNGSMNCQGFFHFIGRNTASLPLVLRKMATQKVEKFVFTDNAKKEIEITLNEEQQQVLMQLSACMLAEAPTLLQ